MMQLTHAISPDRTFIQSRLIFLDAFASDGFAP